uniref:Uncharacterized protein n=1 Tax=Photinus pyralis TaxID=7054 RepID=A0A1Y1LLL8_PHOPY
MWMCYAAENWTKAVDAHTAVERLVQELSALVEDAEHEAVYGLGRFCTEEECNDLVKKYSRGIKLCNLFLNGKYCLTCLRRQLCKAGFEGAAEDLKHWDNSDSSDEENEAENEGEEEDNEEQEEC